MSQEGTGFRQLAAERRLLQEFCVAHSESVLAFQADGRFPAYRGIGPSDPQKAHLTSTATCLESLADVPGYSIAELAAAFAKSSLALAPDAWTSDGSGHIYCRCRALPIIVQHAEGLTRNLKRHLNEIFHQFTMPERLAVGEAFRDREVKDWYPPNGFHTYWTLELLTKLRKFGADWRPVAKKLLVEERTQQMLLWARQILGVQIALHKAASSALDSDQLAWALAILSKFKPGFPTPFEDQDLLRSGLDCLFQTQNSVGIWPHYRPLFHYMKAGNAYCYIFETFAALLRNTLTDTPGGRLLRRALRAHRSSLMRLWSYAQSTAIPLGTSKRANGWCSGHRINRVQEESWATASVFSFAQALRRLLGVWMREDVLETLNRPTSSLEPSEALQQIGERGDSWRTMGAPSVGSQLMIAFANPVLMSEAPFEMRGTAEPAIIRDPDYQPIQADQARSAILFGPPGTGKTSLVRALAVAIGWEYVEIHSSHFVSDGLPNVQRTADEIFRRLMELDHAVVLFDEIDELVRAREDKEADAFGRFLTTSMLPKLAELWQQRKVMYFVNTNHIKYFDSAITRGERFDVLFFVAPSLDAKRERLRRILAPKASPKWAKRLFDGLSSELEKKLSLLGDKKPEEGARLSTQNGLAKLAVVRWDQLANVASHICQNVSPDKVQKGEISVDELTAALHAVPDPALSDLFTYFNFVSDAPYAHRAPEQLSGWRAIGLPNALKLPSIKRTNGVTWVLGTGDDPPIIDGFTIADITSDVCTFRKLRKKEA